MGSSKIEKKLSFILLFKGIKQLRYKIILYILLPTFFVIALVLGYANKKMDEFAVSQVKTITLETSKYNASHIDAQLHDIAQIASTTANILTISGKSLSSKQLYAILEKNVRNNTFIYGAAIAFEPGVFSALERFSPYVYRNGKELVSMDVANSYDYRDPKWEWYDSPLKSGTSIWTEPFFDEGAGNINMVTFSVPFHRDGKIIGVTTVDVDLSKLTIFTRGKDLGANDFIVLSKKGNLVFTEKAAHIGKPFRVVKEALTTSQVDRLITLFSKGESDVIDMTFSDGQSYWISYAKIDSTDWTFSVRKNKKDALLKVTNQETTQTIFIIFAFVLSTVCAFIFAGKITKPISDLNDTAKKITNGDYDVKIAHGGKDEITQLSISFQVMTDKLISREKDLQKTNKKLYKLLDSFNNNVISSRSDLKGNITHASEAFSKISGYSIDELIGKPHNIIRHPDMPKEVFKELWQIIQSGKIWKGEVKNRKKDGSFYWVEAVITPEFDEKGNIIEYSAIRHDITSKKEVEELSANLEIKVQERTSELKESQKRFLTLFDSAPDSIAIINKEGKYIDCNKKTLEIFGVASHNNFIETLPSDHSPEFQENGIRSDELALQKINEAILNGYNRFEWKHKRYDNNEVFDAEVILSSIILGNEPHIYAVVRDISERKKLEKNLSNEKEKLQLLFDNLPIPMILFNQKENKIQYINSKLTELLGYKLCDIAVYDDWFSKVYPDETYRAEVIKFWEDEVKLAAEENRVIKPHIVKTTTKNGEKKIVEFHSLSFGEDYGIALLIDMTDIKQYQIDLENINKHTQESIEYASLIQHALVPENKMLKKYFEDYFVIWHPKDIVGGDIYLFEELRDKKECLLMVIDCTGHGVPGAFVTMLVKAIERQIIAKIENDRSIEVSPAYILSYFNKTMKKLLKQENDESISNAGFDGGILYYNKEKNLIRYAGAETPLFYIQNDELKVIKTDRHSIGYKKSNANYKFTDYELIIDTQTQVYITTDGYLDQNGGEKGFPYGRRKFQKLIEENYNKKFVDQQEFLLNELQSHQGEEERNDDITVIGFSI